MKRRPGGERAKSLGLNGLLVLALVSFSTVASDDAKGVVLLKV